jgi:excisionase family DNA binding protein
MNEFYSPESNIARQRKLDALFADQPFLSPTMRASRLHERTDGPSTACVLQPLPEDADDILRRMTEGRAASTYETAEDSWWFSPPPSVVRENSTAKPAPIAVEPPAAREVKQIDAGSCLTFDVLLDFSSDGTRVAKVHSTDSAPDVMTMEEAADYLRVSLATLRKWTRSHSIPHARFGRRMRYRKSAVLAWLAEWERTV